MTAVADRPTENSRFSQKALFYVDVGGAYNHLLRTLCDEDLK